MKDREELGSDAQMTADQSFKTDWKHEYDVAGMLEEDRKTAAQPVDYRDSEYR